MTPLARFSSSLFKTVSLTAAQHLVYSDGTNAHTVV